MQDIFLPGPAVRDRYKISDPTLWRWMKKRGFPQPAVRPNSRVRLWKVSDLESWEASHAGDGAAA
jgi:predicted DNA-binding transcriptional regulator AlpA